jgi:hypothetical protein
MQAFVSYAHDDHHAFEEFRACLTPVARAFKIKIWADERLLPGDYWRQEIADAIAASQIHILLMSVGFFKSDYIFDHELPAIAARSRDGALTLPVLVEQCYWRLVGDALQAAPIGPRRKLVPVMKWRPRRDGHVAACEQIAGAIKSRFNLAPTPLVDWGKP